MEHILYHPEFGFMKTQYLDMVDRKLSEGVWKVVNSEDINEMMESVESFEKSDENKRPRGRPRKV